MARQVAGAAGVDERPVGDREVPEVARDGGVHAEAAADERDAPAEADRQVDHLLHAMDVRGEGRHQDAAGRLAEDRVELRADRPFRRRHAGVLDVGRVGEQEQRALGAELAESDEVGQPPVERGLIELEVSRVDDGADRRADREPDRVRDGVGHRDGFDREGADAAGLDVVEEQRGREAALAEPLADEAQGEPRAVDGDRPLAEHVRQRADVVLVPVGQEDRLEPFAEAADVRDVRDRDVDAEHPLVREHDAAVDGNRRVPVLEDEQGDESAGWSLTAVRT